MQKGDTLDALCTAEKAIGLALRLQQLVSQKAGTGRDTKTAQELDACVAALHETAVRTYALVRERVTELRPLTEDQQAFGEQAWVYCAKHGDTHRTGWCVEPSSFKTLLQATDERSAIAECHARGFTCPPWRGK